jgi:hypothetical protein
MLASCVVFYFYFRTFLSRHGRYPLPRRVAGGCQTRCREKPELSQVKPFCVCCSGSRPSLKCLLYPSLAFVKEHQRVSSPQRSKGESVGLDLYMVHDVRLLPGEEASINTGLAFKFPFGACGLVTLRRKTTKKFRLHLPPTIVGTRRDS